METHEPSQRQVANKLENTKNGAESGRSRTRTENSHLKALQFMPDEIKYFAQRTLMWICTNGQHKVRRSCGWHISPLTKEDVNDDGTTKTKLRPIALLDMKQAISSHTRGQDTHTLARRGDGTR